MCVPCMVCACSNPPGRDAVMLPLSASSKLSSCWQRRGGAERAAEGEGRGRGRGGGEGEGEGEGEGAGEGEGGGA